jgi:hypothetical protein
VGVRFGFFISGPLRAWVRFAGRVDASASVFDQSPETERLTRVPPMSRGVWREPTLLYFYGANLILRAGLALFGAGFLSSAALGGMLRWSELLKARGAASLRRRRPQLRLRL